MKTVINIAGLTKDFKNNKGNFDINLKIKQGEVFGLVGANGAGKSTLIRQIMGFLKPCSGTINVLGWDAWQDSSKLKEIIGYVPSEVNFPDYLTGYEFIELQAKYLKLDDISYAHELVKLLQLDATAFVNKMSKGMKQKTALVVALMTRPDIIILDEASTGLDPLMRVAFLNIIAKQKKLGKTILISSHLYEELEHLCDRVALIEDGKITTTVDINEVKNRSSLELQLRFNSEKDCLAFENLDYYIIKKHSPTRINLLLEKKQLPKFFKILNDFDLHSIQEEKYTLQKHFYSIIKQKKENTAHDKQGII